MSTISRRGMLQGVVAGAIVVGFDPAARSWVTEARADVPFADIPPLDGTLTTDPAALAAASDDWGHIIHRSPIAVLRPGSVGDVVKMVKYARAHRIKIASRGCGHTPYGQAQAPGGLVIDMRTLNEIHSISHDSAVVDAGVVWRDLLIATTEVGLTPPVLTDYTNLTVGGTLSVGGVGGTSFLHGTQVDNVLQLEVVTGTGDVVVCSQTERATLFEAVLAGLGLCAIIVRATVRLIPAHERAETYRLFYPELPTMFDDIRKLVQQQRFDSVRGNGEPGPDGWTWYIEATRFYTPPAPQGGDLLTGLSFIPGATQTRDTAYFDHCDEVVQLFALLAQRGLLGLPHPWLDIFVPSSVANSFLPQTIANFDLSKFLPGSLVLFYPFVRSAIRQSMFVTPAEDFFLFDVIRTVPPDPSVVSVVVQEHRSIYEQARALGGTLYTISAIPMDEADWRQHFEPMWPLLRSVKAVYDPVNVLGAGLDVFQGP